MHRQISSAPASAVDAARRGQTVGKFCKSCHEVYPLLARRHSGKPSHGKDHVAAPCVYEGQPFLEGAGWWEPAVEVRPADAATA